MSFDEFMDEGWKYAMFLELERRRLPDSLSAKPKRNG